MITERHTLFISDLHLDLAEPQITQAFLRFLQQQAPKAEALYILGDFFETWFGDDNPNELYNLVSAELFKLSQTGIPIYFMHGNRDFLMGEAYFKRCGMKLIPDPTVITLYDKKILLMHGDSLCTNDGLHQWFRNTTRTRTFRRIFLSLPLGLRKLMAAGIRFNSKKHTKRLDYTILDVTNTAVENSMKQHQVNLLIHGHTHRPAIHEFTLDQQSAKRIVLGSWHHHVSALYVDDQGELELQHIPFNATT